MGSTQSRIGFHPDPSKRSFKSKLPENHHNKLVIFGENTVNQVAYLLDSILFAGQESYSSKFRILFGLDSSPVIGISTKELDPENFWIEDNPDMCVWFLAKSKADCGKVLDMPLIENGDEIVLNFVVATGILSVRVIKPGQDASEEISLNLPSGRKFVHPFVGAVSTGKSRVEFLALEHTTIVHMNNELNDVSHKVIFTTTHGVVNLSRDCKSVLRTATQQGNGCALLPVRLSTGIHRWAFVIQSDFGASMCLGLARYPFLLSDEYVKDHLKHVYRHPGLLLYRSYRGLLYKDGKQLTESLGALGWQHNAPVTLEFIYDGSRGTLEILRNGTNLGVAFSNLTGSFQPCVCFYAAYEKDVKLKYYLTTEASLYMVQTSQSSLQEPAPQASATTGGSKNAKVITEIIGFDKSQLHGNAHISEDRKALFREKSQSGNSFCFLNVVCNDPGTYRFSFIIEYDQGASTCLGVTQARSAAEVRLRETGNVYASADLHMYRSFQGMLYFKGVEKARMGEFWMSGTLVEMEVKITSDGGSVTFKVNGESQMDGLYGLKTPLVPLVGFYAGMEKRVTILHYEYEPDMVTPQKTVPKVVVPVPEVVHSKSLPTDKTTSDGLNDIETTASHGPKSLLPIVCSSEDASMFYPSCLKCNGPNDTIALPCRHSTLCAKDLSLGINAPTKRCIICDAKINQIWNVLIKR